MDVYDVIKNRWSVRSYRPNAVEDEKLERIMEAARLAPSAANRQPWYFIIVRDDETKKALKEAYNAKWFYTAPVIICACGKPGEAWKRSDGKSYLDVDIAITMDHLILAATAEGLGTCWIGAFRPEIVKEVLELPDDLEPIALTPLGYPASSPGPKMRKPMEGIAKSIG